VDRVAAALDGDRNLLLAPLLVALHDKAVRS
jgi:hypothetical protein